MPIKITILGSGSATPFLGRHQTSLLADTEGTLYLIDCGEGTQMRLLECGVKTSKIGHIFISHLHGDHFLGLPGLISSFNSLSRKAELHIYGPPGIKELLSINFYYQQTFIDFTLTLHEISGDNKIQIMENGYVNVFAFPLKHRIPTYGYLIEEKQKKPNLDPAKIKNIRHIQHLTALKSGNDVVENGVLIYKAADYTLPATPPASFAFVSDTIYNTDLEQYIKGATCIYHEATFLDSHEARAQATYHSTASQAAQIAKLCQANMLLIGHFSSRYKDTEPFLKEAKKHFEHTYLAVEKKEFLVE
ncbi:MAG: ribonuclease Z [Cytophagales bacterium]|nr:ribonuclease Z [Cytophagales bacterium]